MSGAGNLGLIPTGFRPPTILPIPVIQDNSIGHRIHINTNGTVTQETLIEKDTWNSFTITYAVK